MHYCVLLRPYETYQVDSSKEKAQCNIGYTNMISLDLSTVKVNDMIELIYLNRQFYNIGNLIWHFKTDICLLHYIE